MDRGKIENMTSGLGKIQLVTVDEKDITFKMEISGDSLVLKIVPGESQPIEIRFDDPYELEDMISLLDDAMGHAMRM